MHNSKQRPTDRRSSVTPAYFSAQEAAAYLGISERAFFEHVRRHVRTYRVGRRVLFHPADLDDFLNDHSPA